MKFLKYLLIIFLIVNFNPLNAEDKNLQIKITKNLRCLICQGQSVYDSDSQFANSLKLVVEQKLDEGGQIGWEVTSPKCHVTKKFESSSDRDRSDRNNLRLSVCCYRAIGKLRYQEHLRCDCSHPDCSFSQATGVFIWGHYFQIAQIAL